jgi:heme/copper-type cytochrome/quinol oxidase subunit 2
VIVVEVDVELLVLVVEDVLVVVLVLLVVVLVLVVVVLVLVVVGAAMVVEVVVVDVNTEVPLPAGGSVAGEAELVWTAQPAVTRTRVMTASVTSVRRSATSGRHATPAVCQRPSSCGCSIESERR